MVCPCRGSKLAPKQTALRTVARTACDLPYMFFLEKVVHKVVISNTVYHMVPTNLNFYFLRGHIFFTVTSHQYFTDLRGVECHLFD